MSITRTTHSGARHVLLPALIAIVAALAVAAPPANAAPPPTITDTCSRTVNGRWYYAQVYYKLTGGSGGSSYYINTFKTGGERISSAQFILYQGMRTSSGYNYVYSGVISKSNLAGNTAYIAGPSWTGYAFVWITRNQSISGSTHEKTAIMDVWFNAGGTRFSCRMITRQP